MPELQPPYSIIAQQLDRGLVVPFLGAGVNVGTDATDRLPTGSELSRKLADETEFPSKDNRDRSDLGKVASYYVEAAERRLLRQRLRREFIRKPRPGPIHKYLASVETPLLIVTTNYDDLLEQAFNDAGQPYDLVVHPTDRPDISASVLWWRHGDREPTAAVPNVLSIDLSTTTVIYKMHGTINREHEDYDSYVITEDDYVDFLSLMASTHGVPSIFMNHYRTRNFLFLGYGLGDWNTRVILRKLRGLIGPADRAADRLVREAEQVKSWAIQYRPTQLEQRLWWSRRVDIYDVPIDTFVERLKARRPRPPTPDHD